MASETVDPIDCSHPPTLHRAVPPELHVLHSSMRAANHKTYCTDWDANVRPLEREANALPVRPLRVWIIPLCKTKIPILIESRFDLHILNLNFSIASKWNSDRSVLNSIFIVISLGVELLGEQPSRIKIIFNLYIFTCLTLQCVKFIMVEKVNNIK